VKHRWWIEGELKEPVKEKMPFLLEEFKKLLPYLPPLAGPDGTGEPVLTKEEVAFNGLGPDQKSPFVFPGEEKRGGLYVYGECVTGDGEAPKAYDLAVRTFLVLAGGYIGGTRVLSDAPGAKWAEAALLAEKACGIYAEDLLQLLGLGLLEVEDSRGLRFAVDWWREAEKPEEALALLSLWEGRASPEPSVAPRLARAYAPSPGDWPFRGPYRAVGEKKLSPDGFSARDLVERWDERGFYRLEDPALAELANRAEKLLSEISEEVPFPDLALEVFVRSLAEELPPTRYGIEEVGGLEFLMAYLEKDGEVVDRTVPYRKSLSNEEMREELERLSALSPEERPPLPFLPYTKRETEVLLKVLEKRLELKERHALRNPLAGLSTVEWK